MKIASAVIAVVFSVLAALPGSGAAEEQPTATGGSQAFPPSRRRDRGRSAHYRAAGDDGHRHRTS
ncbi:MAG: hypothetical protein ACREYE_27370 [Gammaproteobacteria bacterium]